MTAALPLYPMWERSVKHERAHAGAVVRNRSRECW